MNRATLALLNKELAQHGALLIALAGFALIATWAQIVLAERLGSLTSYLSVASLFAMPILVLIAIVLGQQLVVREYTARAQRFVEALPVARGHHEWVKWSLGYVTLLAISLGVWLYTVSLAAQHEPLTGWFLLLMALRLTVYVFVVWSCVFTLSFLGRLRLGLAALATLILVALDAYTPFELDRFGPFRLMDSQRFASERLDLPFVALLESLVIGVAALALARYFMRLREGSFVERLSVPMSARDKSFVLVLAVVGIGAATLFGGEDDDFAFDLGEANVVVAGRVAVAHIEPRWADEAAELVQHLDERMSQLDRIAPVPEHFRLGVTFSPLVEPMDYDVEHSSPTFGVLVTADISRSDDRDFFGAFVFHEVLDTLMLGRTTSMEPLHVLHDGFSLYWAVHGAQPPPRLDANANPDPLLVRALYGARVVGITPARIGEWDRTMEALGDASALAFTYSGWRSLVDEVGHERAMDLARQIYHEDYHGDARDWWTDTWHPIEDRFEAATGITWKQHIEAWGRRIEHLASQPAWSAALAQMPVADFSLSAAPGEFGADIILDSRLRIGIDGETRCRLLHTRIAWFDTPLSPRGMREVIIHVPPGARSVSHVLTGIYGSGTRMAGALECTPPGEVVPVRLGMRRLIVP